MKRFALLWIICFFCMFVHAERGRADLREGDIIFQTSKSSQSKFIAYATNSINTHCGIIVYQNDRPYVLEASNVVKLTPLNNFINKGALGARYSVYRYTDKPIKIRYKKYMGISYDSQFSLTNKKFYCSELVWVIYKEQFGVELCKPRPLSSYNTLGLGKIMKRRGISSKSLFVAPSDLAASKKLHRIKE